MPFLQIVGLRTVNQFGQNATLFHLFDDALALTWILVHLRICLRCRTPHFRLNFSYSTPIRTRFSLVATGVRDSIGVNTSGSVRETTGVRQPITKRLRSGGLVWTALGSVASCRPSIFLAHRQVVGGRRLMRSMFLPCAGFA